MGSRNAVKEAARKQGCATRKGRGGSLPVLYRLKLQFSLEVEAARYVVPGYFGNLQS